MRAATACPAGRLLQWRVIGCSWAEMQGLGEKSLAPLTTRLKPDLGRPGYSVCDWLHPCKSLSSIKRLTKWYARQSRMVRDLIVMGAIGLPLYLLAVWYDSLDKFLAFTNEPQSDAIDWLVILFVFLGVAAKIYSVRLTIDLRSEVVARRKAQAEAHQMARHDVLTGLPNRRRFIEDLNRSTEYLPGRRNLRAVCSRSR